MQITKCTLSRSHIAKDERFNLSVTLKMGSSESLPSSGYGSLVEVDALMPNRYNKLDLRNNDGSVVSISNPGIAKGGSKTLNFSNVYLSSDPVMAGRDSPFVVSVAATRYDGDWGDTWIEDYENAGTVLKSRIDPVINGVTMTDLHARNPLSHFGDYIQGRSLPRIAADVTLDPLDPTLTAVHTLTLTHGGNTIYSASNATGIFEPGALAVSGAVGWSYTVTDSAGKSAGDSGSFMVLSYAAPVISTLRAERYKVVLDDVGDPSYPAADDGELVRFTISADVASVAALNAWDMSIKYGRSDGTGGTTIVTPLTGTDGAPETIRKIDDRTLLTAALPASADHDFEVTLSDFFGPVKLVVSVYKAGGYFNVEKFGTGSGMRTTGTPESPCSDFAWPIKAWAGVVDGDGREIVAPADYSTDEVDTGQKWINGKPIYSRILVHTYSVAGSRSVSHGIANFDDIWIDTSVSFLHAPSTSSIYPVGYINSSGTRIYYLLTYTNNTDILVGNQYAGTCYIGIRYTKTTD